MSREIYVNGSYLPWSQAGVHAEDRGFQFADAVYEVCEVAEGALVDQTRHLDRLERSLRELEIPMLYCQSPFSQTDTTGLGQVLEKPLHPDDVWWAIIRRMNLQPPPDLSILIAEDNPVNQQLVLQYNYWRQ